ncbi:MAG: hypothetical protein MUF57_10545 [Gammaproteobacteria bacterium]|nr:hypothetical protein [Gammaproteobacteria bacterium]
MKTAATYLFAALAGAAFLYMVKLMHDMTGHVGRMSDQVEVMTGHVGRMRADVRGMHESMNRMTGVVQRGSQQIEQFNPMEMMKQIAPAQRQ